MRNKVEAADAIRVEVKRLYVSFLILLEDIQQRHDNSFDKLLENVNEDQEGLVDQAEFFDEDTREYFRKKVLDSGNDCIRRLDGVLKSLER